MTELPFNRWQCQGCDTILSDYIADCPICKRKSVDKKEIKEINRNHVKSIYDARVNISTSRKAYLKRVREVQKLAAESRLEPAKLKPYLVSKEESAENKKKLLEQLKEIERSGQ